jgi:hypothetical protein
MDRKDKSLYQLQIEVCELALAELPKVTHFSKEQKDQARRAIEGQLDKLQRTKRPVFLKYPRFYLPYLGAVYDAETAKLIRDAVRSGSADVIYINK